MIDIIECNIRIKPFYLCRGKPENSQQDDTAAGAGQESIDCTAHEIFPAADDADDEPTADLPTQRMQFREKNAWMRRSMLAK